MEDSKVVPENPTEEMVAEPVADKEPTVLTVTIKPTLADIRQDFHAITDALIIAPRADRKLAKDVIHVIKNTSKIERRRDLETKKTSMPTQIYDIDDLRLEIECKLDSDNKCHFDHPRIITVINRKTKKILDRVTKPFLVARIASAVYGKEEQIKKSSEALEASRKIFQNMSDKQKQK